MGLEQKQIVPGEVEINSVSFYDVCTNTTDTESWTVVPAIDTGMDFSVFTPPFELREEPKKVKDK
jgi:hypothetical protein